MRADLSKTRSDLPVSNTEVHIADSNASLTFNVSTSQPHNNHQPHALLVLLVSGILG